MWHYLGRTKLASDGINLTFGVDASNPSALTDPPQKFLPGRDNPWCISLRLASRRPRLRTNCSGRASEYPQSSCSIGYSLSLRQRHSVSQRDRARPRPRFRTADRSTVRFSSQRHCQIRPSRQRGRWQHVEGRVHCTDKRLGPCFDRTRSRSRRLRRARRDKSLSGGGGGRVCCAGHLPNQKQAVACPRFERQGLCPHPAFAVQQGVGNRVSTASRSPTGVDAGPIPPGLSAPRAFDTSRNSDPSANISGQVRRHPFRAHASCPSRHFSDSLLEAVHRFRRYAPLWYTCLREAEPVGRSAVAVLNSGLGAERFEVSSTAFSAQPPDLQPVPLMDMDFAVNGPFAMTSPPSGCQRDFHPRAAEHARHTTQKAAIRRSRPIGRDHTSLHLGVASDFRIHGIGLFTVHADIETLLFVALADTQPTNNVADLQND